MALNILILNLFHKSKNVIFLFNIHPAKFKIFKHNLCMKYLDSKKLSDSQFKRYTGIFRSTFSLMVEQMQMQIPSKGGHQNCVLKIKYYSV